MIISCIAAVADNWVIGKDGKLPWHLPADLKFFKRATWDHYVITGRRSYESIGGGLPGRHTILLTSQKDYHAPDAVVAHSMEQALALCSGKAKVYILGGEELYRKTMERPIANELLLTRVHEQFEGDTFFPAFSAEEWSLDWEQYRAPDEKNPIPMTFQRWSRYLPIGQDPRGARATAPRQATPGVSPGNE